MTESPNESTSPDREMTGPEAAGPADGWKSRIGVILAVAGSAVGLGNFLRFPGQAAQNGGGAFLLPYFISLLILGIPLAWAEWTIGRYAGQRGFTSAPGIFSVLCRDLRARYLGVLGLLIPLVIYMYYVVIEAWCLAYAWHYLVGTELLVGKEGDVGEFFDGLVGVKTDGSLFGDGGRTLLVIVGLTFVLNFVLIYRGVGKGIELFCKTAIPLMVVLAVIVLIRVLTLPADTPGTDGRSVTDGLGFMWNPDTSALTDPKTWLAAAGQIFFSLSVGFGVVINYSSYLSKRDDVALSGLTACSMNEFFEVCLGGLITLPAAFIFLGAAAGGMGTFGLGFNALPEVFLTMPGGQFFGFAWFFMLFTAAMTSSISMLQPVIAFLEEGFDLPRPASAAILGLIGLGGSAFVLYFSAGLTALDTLDFWVGTFAIFLLAMAQSVIYGWVFGVERGHREMHLGSHIRVPFFVQLILKYVVPLYMGVIFVAFCVQNAPGYVTALSDKVSAQLSIGLIVAVIAFLALMTHLAGNRWQSSGRWQAALDAPIDTPED